MLVTFASKNQQFKYSFSDNKGVVKFHFFVMKYFTLLLQVLSGKPLGVKLFGYSLAGNMDLDKNSYPDLAVGSLSDSVFVYR